MTRYRFTPQAARDLFDIWDYIAQDSPQASDKAEEAISRACGFASDGYGAKRPDLTASAVLGGQPVPELSHRLRP
jgi:plasmid stabilization system protein ParE